MRKKEREKTEKTKFKKGEITKVVLAVLGIGVVLGGSVLITPNFPLVVGSLIKLIEEIKGIKIPRIKLKRTLERLQKKEIIDLQVKDNQVYVQVKDKWNVEMIKYSIESLLELKKREKKWEGKWFLVVFDVPVEEGNKRYYLRKFLKDIGFYPYQQSIYVYPYECEKEVALIKKIVEGGKYIRYIIAEKIEGEEQLKSFFNL